MMKINLFYKKIFLVSFCISCLFIINSQAQMYTVPYSGSNSYTTCSGILYDHGGTGYYSNSANGYTTLYPVNRVVIILIFMMALVFPEQGFGAVLLVRVRFH